MTDIKNMSIMELMHQILSNSKKAMTFIEIFDLVCAKKGISDEEKAEIISQVYSDMVTSAKFIYVGDDEWDIKGRQTIDLWDKDGAYYDEYPDYEEELNEYDSNNKYPEEEIKEPVEVKDVLEEVFVEVEEDLEYDAFVEDEEDYIEDIEDLSFDKDLEKEVKEEFVEEEEEDKEEFDDEEYNEYMDAYEEMYED